MSQDDFGDDWVTRPIEQDEDFFNEEMGNILHSVSAVEREKVTCYYKLRGILPSEPEYAVRCPTCNGFPIKEGCVNYVTQDHIEGFQKRFGINRKTSDVPTGLDDLDQQFPPKTLDDIGSWRGPATFGN